VILGAQMEFVVQVSLREQQSSPQENWDGRQQVLKSGSQARANELDSFTPFYGDVHTYLWCSEKVRQYKLRRTAVTGTVLYSAFCF